MEHFDIKSAYELIYNKLEGWLAEIVVMLPNLVLAVLTLCFFYFVAKIIKRGVRKAASHLSDNLSLNFLLETVVYWSVLIVGTFIALDILELEKTVTSLLAGVGVIGLALGFAFQDTAANFVSGVFLAVRSPIEVGDIIQSGDVVGIVQQINLRSTEVETFQGNHVTIPNKDVFQNPLYNFTHSGKRRVDLSCGISYGDDLEKVKEITTKAVLGAEGIIKSKGVNLFFTEFGDSSINFVVVAWAEKIDEAGYLSAQSNMIVAIKAAFDANNITIPFPIRTLDFGIKGGEKLNEMLNAE